MKKKVDELLEKIEFSDEDAVTLYETKSVNNWRVIANKVDSLTLGNYPSANIVMVLMDKKTKRLIRSEFQFSFYNDIIVNNQNHYEVKKNTNKKYNLDPYKHFKFVKN